MSKQKVILVGWDAADWKIINPLLDEGKLPNLQRMIDAGCMGKLRTIKPVFSPMIWTSIATGKRPYKHGIHGFQEVRPDRSGIQPIMGHSRRVKALWNILGERGLKTHVVGWWPSHPAENINGICISDMYHKSNREADPADWKLSPGTVSPEGMAEHFKALRVHPREMTEAHVLPFIPRAGQINQAIDQYLYNLSVITSQAATMHSAFTNILRTQEWDFAAVYLDAIDHYCHGFMKFHPPHRPTVSKADYDLYHNVVTAAYQYHDLMLKRIMDFVDEDTTLILVSDHGFQPDHLRPKVLPNEPASPALEHSPHGIIVAMGPGIKKDELLYGASVLDITPTVLRCFGLPRATDMDGKVLQQLFTEATATQAIPTYEDPEGFVHSGGVMDEESQLLMLQQLEDLGYIEPQTGDQEKNIERTEKELAFNLACAYIDGRQLREGIAELEKLVARYPRERRFLYQLAVCYQSVGNLAQCRSYIDRLKEMDIYLPGTIDILEGTLLLGEKKPQEAMAVFKRAERSVDPNTSRINLLLARCHFRISRFENALRLLEKEKAIDPDQAEVYQLAAKCHTKRQEYELAVENALQATSLDFFSPVAHYILGNNLYSLGRYEEAAAALENALKLAPSFNEARKLLIVIYQTHLHQPEKAQAYRRKFEAKIEGTLYIVSGMPRSGTSMMMQMLERGGLEVFTDRQREADENNPRGYYEHELVKTLPRNKSWLPQAEGKVVKIIANLLPHLPANYQYKIVFMERATTELLQSQDRMLERLGKGKKDPKSFPTHLAASFEQSIQRSLDWMTTNPNVEYIRIRHHAVIENPFEQALRINDFFANGLRPERKAAAVDRQLHRERTSRV